MIPQKTYRPLSPILALALTLALTLTRALHHSTPALAPKLVLKRVLKRALNPYTPALVLTLVLKLFPFLLPAQSDYPYSTPTFTFVDAKASVLQYPGRPDAMAHLYRKMDRLLLQGEGQVNIVHIGGSHVQADMWTDRLRQRFQTAFEGARGNRGFIFPYKLAATNGPIGYITEHTGRWESCRNVQANRACNLGLSGYVATTRDTLATLRLRLRDPEQSPYDFDRIRVFHEHDSTTYSLSLLVDGKPAPSRVNTELGYTEFALGAHRQSLDFEIRRTDSLQDHFSLHGIALDNSDPGFIYHAIGVNGASTASYRRCALFTPHLKALQPDLVLFSVGINDANTTDFDVRAYEQNYDTLITWVRRANPHAAILLTTNTDSYYKRKYPNKNAALVRDAMVRLAKRHNATVWDTWAVMGGLGSIKHWIKAGLANNDKVHLLLPGYQLLADHLFNAIMQDYDNHLRMEAARTE